MYTMASASLTANLMDMVDNLENLISFKSFHLQVHEASPQMKANQHELLFGGFLTKLLQLLLLVHRSLALDYRESIYTDLCDLFLYMGHDNTQFLQWMNLPDNSFVLGELVWTTVPTKFLTTRD